ncbi:hypothetical protein LCGC14_0373530 [marine sediment metagenome]|uniref:Uncharacterized protein n=1 Tax=marine sediment metagenome TaxID=412755 RepID=A0A0F9WD48_9ZZZZ
MKLIKGKRVARWLPFDWEKIKQVRHGKRGRKFGLVEFEGTKEELVVAKRLGRPVPRHRAWVNMSSLMEHEK